VLVKKVEEMLLLTLDLLEEAVELTFLEKKEELKEVKTLLLMMLEETKVEEKTLVVNL